MSVKDLEERHCHQCRHDRVLEGWKLCIREFHIREIVMLMLFLVWKVNPCLANYLIAVVIKYMFLVSLYHCLWMYIPFVILFFPSVGTHNGSIWLYKHLVHVWIMLNSCRSSLSHILGLVIWGNLWSIFTICMSNMWWRIRSTPQGLLLSEYLIIQVYPTSTVHDLFVSYHC